MYSYLIVLFLNVDTIRYLYMCNPRCYEFILIARLQFI